VIRRTALPFATLLLFAAPAFADETNPAVEACKGKKEGDACQAMTVRKPEGGEAERSATPGVCKPDQCCALDYSSGSPPKSVCSECLACKAGAPEPTETGGATTSGSEPPPVEGGATPPVGTTEPPPTEPGKKGCAMAAPAAMWPLFVLALAGWRRRAASRRASSRSC
jgi:hypothetical protein